MRRSSSEQGLSTSLDELLVSRGRLYLVERDRVPVGLGGLKPISGEIAEIKRMFIRPAARGTGSADSYSDNCSQTHEHWILGSSVWKAAPSCPKR